MSKSKAAERRLFLCSPIEISLPIPVRRDFHQESAVAGFIEHPLHIERRTRVEVEHISLEHPRIIATTVRAAAICR